jgi:FtsZ-binding cell division protein ZapB
MTNETLDNLIKHKNNRIEQLEKENDQLKQQIEMYKECFEKLNKKYLDEIT